IALHDVWMLSRSLSAIWPRLRVRRGVRAQPGAPLQYARLGGDAQRRAARRRHGAGWRRRLWQGAELRRGLPQGDPTRRFDRRRRTRYDEAHAVRVATQVARQISGPPIPPIARAPARAPVQYGSRTLRRTDDGLCAHLSVF